MQPAEYEGIWWLPRAPDSTVVGKLTFDGAGGLQLNAIGMFTNCSAPQFSETVSDEFELLPLQ